MNIIEFQQKTDFIKNRLLQDSAKAYMTKKVLYYVIVKIYKNL